VTALPAPVPSLIAQLERIASEIDPGAAPTLLGELERIKAIAMRQMSVSPPSDTVDSLLTAEEAAAFLKVPVSWVEESARNGRLACVRLGRYVRFRKPDLLRTL
jgi:excisionase family DNA binding protein